MTSFAKYLQALQRYGEFLFRRSLKVPRFFNRNIVWISAGWVGVAGLIASLRMAFPASPIHNFSDSLPILVAYASVILAPICGYMLARWAYPNEQSRTPLDFHLSFVGRWKRIDPEEAKRDPLFGPVGFLASLLIGLVLNVVVRTGEYYVAVPAMSTHAPNWGLELFWTMTLDLVVMNFLYMVAFVMALRSIPLFPRMLLFVWLTDIVMQLVIAQHMANVSTLPSEVISPLVSLLQGNVTKVLISVAVWLPYLILSRRVNLTYRSRKPA